MNNFKIFLLVFVFTYSSLSGQSVSFIDTTGAGNQDYAIQDSIPDNFGTGEFTFQMFVKLDESWPVGPTGTATEDINNWNNDNILRYSSSTWWFNGNFLIDGHNNVDDEARGTFALQVYGRGRIRWQFSDASLNQPTGGPWAAQALDTSDTSSLLDDAWHVITCRRRFVDVSDSELDLWIDGVRVGSDTSDVRTNMQTSYWQSWTGFPVDQEGWFYGAEKQAAIGLLSEYEDYKGLIDDVSFWSVAQTDAWILNNYNVGLVGNEANLVGWYNFTTVTNDSTVDFLNSDEYITFFDMQQTYIELENAPYSGSSGAIQGTIQGTIQ